jgi:hypothetical protein
MSLVEPLRARIPANRPQTRPVTGTVTASGFAIGNHQPVPSGTKIILPATVELGHCNSRSKTRKNCDLTGFDPGRRTLHPSTKTCRWDPRIWWLRRLSCGASGDTVSGLATKYPCELVLNVLDLELFELYRVSDLPGQRTGRAEPKPVFPTCVADQAASRPGGVCFLSVAELEALLLSPFLSP